MARFSGEVGYAISEQTAPGVWQDRIEERRYFGDVVREARSFDIGNSVNAGVRSTNSISIVADPFAFANFSAMRYVRWMGTLWTINSIEVERPRLLLRLGGEWNGNTGGTSSDVSEDTGIYSP